MFHAVHRTIACFVLIAMCSAVHAQVGANDLKVNQLEQDVRDLRQQLSTQSRRIDRLEGELSRATGISRRSAEAAPRPEESSKSDTSPAWLKSANWERVRAGMTEADVLSALGAPTTLRKSDDGKRQTLFYALEIGTGSYLSGSVILEGKQVVEVNKPALR